MLPAMGKGVRRFKVEAELIVEVTDPKALTRKALEAVDATAFPAQGGQSGEEVHAAVRAEARDDVAAALEWLTDPDAMIITDAGLHVVESAHTIVEVDEHGTDLGTQPDFAGLFPLCQCGKPDCDACTGFQLTPRTAAALWAVAQLLADQVYDDVAEHGDDPVTDDGNWSALSDYPRITWRQDAVWRRQAARAFDDLTADLEAGRAPVPTCPGEEMALHLMVRTAEAALADGWGVPPGLLSRLPEHADDFDWELALDVLVQDEDILTLFDEQHDGIEDPESPDNRLAGMGDYRPGAWFRPFLSVTPRDGRRGFRR